MKISFMTSTLTIALSTALLWHFSNIVRFGSHLIQEPQPITLWAEIGLLMGCLSMGVFGLIKTIK